MKHDSSSECNKVHQLTGHNLVSIQFKVDFPLRRAFLPPAYKKKDAYK